MPAARTPSERSALAALAAHFAPEEVAEDLAAHSAADVWQQRVQADASGRLARYRPEEELNRSLLYCQFITRSDEGWPTALTVLGERQPLGLWVLGRDRLPGLTASTVAVTGNRNATAHALSYAEDYARAVSEAGHTVTATLAFGVDAAAHQAAALTGRATLAVLPRGLDRAHPYAHAALMKQIVSSGGAVISLYPPGTPASGATHQASAHLLAALSKAVILIEALDHSHTLRTAQAALDLRRPLLTAPPAEDDIRAGGTARLIAEQRAVLCPHPAHALALL
ncbi:DNA-processing protein DprA [Streptomyces sp. NPDC052693]|uniref:DNA-processing protein DprA n=1 Tax=Streptomyces sp. NPDC052693 TaxID=3155814 RepID=UPI003428EF4E